MEQFDWQGDRPLNLPMEELVVYEMHVRGFTQDASSGVQVGAPSPTTRMGRGAMRWGVRGASPGGGRLPAPVRGCAAVPVLPPQHGCQAAHPTSRPPSRVQAPGTYLGVVEKLDYLKALGVTALELLPVYEFNELEYYTPIPGT